MSLFDMLPTKRRCGECDLCCTSLWVRDLDKPPMTPCKHLCGTPGSSCSIYKDRPNVCKEYSCLWRASDTLIPAALWPAKCGFLISLNGTFGTFPPVITVAPNPDYPNAWNKPHHRKEFFRLARLFNAIVVIGEDEFGSLMFSPKGNTFSREDYPHLFAEGGRRIGLPETEFLPHRPTKNDLAALLFFT